MWLIVLALRLSMVKICAKQQALVIKRFMLLSKLPKTNHNEVCMLTSAGHLVLFAAKTTKVMQIIKKKKTQPRWQPGMISFTRYGG